MKTSSAKAKGRNLQNHVAECIRTKFANHDPACVRPAIMGENGVDIHLYGAIKTLFPFSIECKNQEALNIWASWKQAVINTEKGTKTALIIKRNHQIPLIVLDFNEFLFDILPSNNNDNT